jgi:hypothetical protein
MLFLSTIYVFPWLRYRSAARIVSFHFGGFSVVFALIWLPEIFSLEEDIKKFNSQKRFFIDHMDGKVP